MRNSFVNENFLSNAQNFQKRYWIVLYLMRLEQIKNNLSDIKVLYLTNGCLKNLAHAKNAMCAQNLKNSMFGAINFTFPPIFRNCVPASNQACRGAQNSLNHVPFQYLTSKHDVHTSGTLRIGFADFWLLKFWTS